MDSASDEIVIRNVSSVHSVKEAIVTPGPSGSFGKDGGSNQRATLSHPGLQPSLSLPNVNQGSSQHRPPSQRVNNTPQRPDNNEHHVTFNVLEDYLDAGEEAATQPSADRHHHVPYPTPAKPDELRRLLGIPEFQTRFAGERSYNYEEKYPPDKPGNETGPDARFWKVYLDEAEVYDQEMIRSHRDSLDSLLVFAALFSAVVTTFVVQTSQALEPDQSIITNHLLLYQIQLLQAAGNATAIAALAPTDFTPDTMTYEDSDVWVNGLFFTSLALSLATALLSVLAKQWLQAYDSSTSGSARERALVRHLRFMGLTQWKLNEIIGALPLILHVSLAVFAIGLVLFLRALYPTLSWSVLGISGVACVFYIGSIVLPAFYIRCPYRIPLLYRPVTYVVLTASLLAQWLRISPSTVGPPSSPGPFHILWRLVKAPIWRIVATFKSIFSWGIIPPSLKESELISVQSFHLSIPFVHDSIRWLHDMSSNWSVRRVAAQSLAGEHCSSHITEMHPSFIPVVESSIVKTVTEGLFETEDLPPGPTTSRSPLWIRALENLRDASYSWRLSPCPVTRTIASDLHRAAYEGRVNHVSRILTFAVDVNALDSQGVTPLQVAAYWGHIDVVSVLLDNGADVRLTGRSYGSALDAARRLGHWDVFHLLAKRGGAINAAASDTSSDSAHSEPVEEELKASEEDEVESIKSLTSSLRRFSIPSFLPLSPPPILDVERFRLEDNGPYTSLSIPSPVPSVDEPAPRAPVAEALSFDYDDLIPPSRCKFCNLALPPSLSAPSLAFYANLLSHAKHQDRGLISTDSTREFCSRHRRESNLRPLMAASGWPIKVDFAGIIPRLSTPSALDYLQWIACCPSKSDAFSRANDFYAVVIETPSGSRQRRQTGLDTRPRQMCRSAGYYGPGAFELIRVFVQRIFPPEFFPPSSLECLHYETFIQEVLVPEAVAILIREDLPVHLPGSLSLVEESYEVGVVFQPDAEDDNIRRLIDWYADVTNPIEGPARPSPLAYDTNSLLNLISY